MPDKTVKKVSAEGSPKGAMGQRYLVTGVSMGMRMWDEMEPGQKQEAHARDYETIGYVIKGRAELHIEGQKVLLEPGDSWIVPKGAKHFYKILDPFTGVEVTHPPAHIHDRDAP